MSWKAQKYWNIKYVHDRNELCVSLLQDGSSCDDTKTLSELMKTITKIFLPPYGGT
jgi:hypothetical protein